MRLAIRHETAYRYSVPAPHSIQQLRLTPRAEPRQRVLAWRIDAPGKLQRFIDAYGNVTHTLVLSTPHESIRVVVEGSVEVDPGRSGPDPAPGELSPLVFSVATPLTAAEEPVRAFASRHLLRKSGAADFLTLAEAICGAGAYESGITEVISTAANALAIARGVCQDHAHLFIACCRAAGPPAPPRHGRPDPCAPGEVD